MLALLEVVVTILVVLLCTKLFLVEFLVVKSISVVWLIGFEVAMLLVIGMEVLVDEPLPSPEPVKTNQLSDNLPI